MFNFLNGGQQPVSSFKMNLDRCKAKKIFEPESCRNSEYAGIFLGLSVQWLDGLVEEQIDVVNNVFSSDKTYTTE